MQTRQSRGSAAKGAPTRLKWDDKGQILVHPESNDLFFLPPQEAVRACISQAEFRSFARMMNDKWNHFCSMVSEWCASHREVVRALISRRESEYLLLLVLEGDAQHPRGDSAGCD